MASVALAAAIALATAGCQTIQPTETTGSLGTAGAQNSDAEWRRSADAWGERYRANPQDPDAAINYAQALRGIGQRAQAVAVLEQAAIQNPKHTGVLGAYGRALADAGNYKQALDVLNRAHTPDQPDWRILSVQGAVLDQMGRHEDAQRYYATALRIVPDEPSVLSNLGLSYALSKDLVRAESTLRRASTQARADAACAAEPRAGGRAAGPLHRGGGDRARRPAVRRGGRQCRLSAADAGAAERLEAARPAGGQGQRQLIEPIVARRLVTGARPATLLNSSRSSA